ncbi:MAG: type II toxin-antitoxin system mRNA interferase toxin, RelE/StbE family [Campylobacterales bacterium]|nr:type II toxin-antitoxin system mRNA interferase toxin, RelE/StbE family [Campylobacterales bacterium]
MNYKILITDSYLKKLKKFLKKHPDIIQRYSKTMEILEVNPHHPSLRLHKLQGRLCEFYSISINIEYRVVMDFIIKENEIIPIDVGSHDAVY